MTPGEKAAREGLDRDQMRTDIREAVRDGIADAMTDENAERFWELGLAVLKKQATEQTGEFVLGGLSVVVKRLMWAALILLALWMFGGWPALKAGWALVSKVTP